MGCLRCQEAVLPSSHGAAAGGEDNHIVSNQLENHLKVVVIVNCPSIVTPDYTGNSPNPTIDDIVIERTIRGPVEPS